MKKHFVVLDSWRGICAVLVAIHHLVWFSVNNYQNRFVESFFLFVDFFFVLSGFVIAFNYYKGINSFNQYLIYFVRRVGRVWPAHAVVMIAFVVYLFFLIYFDEQVPYTIGASPTTYDIRKFPLVLMLTNSFGIYSGGWNLPSWSIAAELFAYFTFGLVFLYASRLRYSFFLTLVGFIGVVLLGGGQINLTANFGVVRCLWGFGFGVLVYRAWSYFEQSEKCLKLMKNAATELLALASVIVFLWLSINIDGSANALSLFSPLIFGVVVFIFAFESGKISRVLMTRMMQSIGKLSYSIYINHWLIILMMASFCKYFYDIPYIQRNMWGGTYLLWDLSVDLHFWVSLFLFVTIVLLVSSFTYSRVEDPCRLYVGRFASSLRRV